MDTLSDTTSRRLRRLLLPLLAILLCGGAVSALDQPRGLFFDLSQTVTGGTASELPLWMHANRWGLLESRGAQAVSRAALRGHQELPARPLEIPLVLRYHLVVLQRLNSEEPPQAELNTGYGHLSWGPLYASAGRVPLEKGEHYSPLSSGSLVLSTNARPLRRVTAGLEWTPLPLTDGAVEVKGSVGHGWLEKDRHVQNPWVLERDAYLRVNDPFGWGLSIYRGLVQEIVWAGTNQDGTKRPRGWDNFWRVFTSSEGDADASASEQQNRLGDTLGMWDQGIVLHRPDFRLHLYHQHFFEDGSGFRMGRNQEWDEKWRRWRDGLTGVHLELPQVPRVRHILYEFVYTKHQSGPGYHGETGGWDNYWEHGQYRTGWTYRGRMIGPPLVTVDPDLAGSPIVHSRIVAHHAGLQGELGERTRYRLLGTYLRSYGTYNRNVPGDERPTAANPDGSSVRGDSIFRNGLEQWSFLAELGREAPLFGVSGLYGAVALALDWGELRADSVAVMLTLGYGGGL